MGGIFLAIFLVGWVWIGLRTLHARRRQVGDWVVTFALGVGGSVGLYYLLAPLRHAVGAG